MLDVVHTGWHWPARGRNGDSGRWDARETRNRADPRHMVVISDRPAHVAQRAHEHGEREDEPELGLVDALVALRHPDDPPVVERAGGDDGEEDPDEASEVCQAL